MVALSFLPMLGGVLSYLTLIIWAATWIVTARNSDGWCRSNSISQREMESMESDPGKISMVFRKTTLV